MFNILNYMLITFIYNTIINYMPIEVLEWEAESR